MSVSNPGVAALGMTVALMSSTVVAQQSLPVDVQKAFSALQQMCEAVGGSFEAPQESLQHGDLNHDGQPDFLIDEGKLICHGQEGMFLGSGGSSIDILVSTSDGYINAWSDTALGARIKGDQVWITVAGGSCGDTSPTSTAEAVSCERPLVWSAGEQGMILAPGNGSHTSPVR